MIFKVEVTIIGDLENLKFKKFKTLKKSHINFLVESLDTSFRREIILTILLLHVRSLK